jgi:hypothetical protein
MHPTRPTRLHNPIEHIFMCLRRAREFQLSCTRDGPRDHPDTVRRPRKRHKVHSSRLDLLNKSSCWSRNYTIGGLWLVVKSFDQGVHRNACYNSKTRQTCQQHGIRRVRNGSPGDTRPTSGSTFGFRNEFPTWTTWDVWTGSSRGVNSDEISLSLARRSVAT